MHERRCSLLRQWEAEGPLSVWEIFVTAASAWNALVVLARVCVTPGRNRH